MIQRVATTTALSEVTAVSLTHAGSVTSDGQQQRRQALKTTFASYLIVLDAPLDTLSNSVERGLAGALSSERTINSAFETTAKYNDIVFIEASIPVIIKGPSAATVTPNVTDSTPLASLSSHRPIHCYPPP